MKIRRYRSDSKAYVGDISQAIADIAQEYGQNVRKIVNSVIPDVAKDTVKKIRENVGAAGIGHGSKGEYAKGWNVEITTKTATGDPLAIIYNDKPGLPHLLEFDHALRQGGRTRPHEHIAPAEEWAREELVNRVKGAL